MADIDGYSFGMPPVYVLNVLHRATYSTQEMLDGQCRGVAPKAETAEYSRNISFDGIPSSRSDLVSVHYSWPSASPACDGADASIEGGEVLHSLWQGMMREIIYCSVLQVF